MKPKKGGDKKRKKLVESPQALGQYNDSGRNKSKFSLNSQPISTSFSSKAKIHQFTSSLDKPSHKIQKETYKSDKTEKSSQKKLVASMNMGYSSCKAKNTCKNEESKAVSEVLIESPKKNDSSTTNVRVVARIRPLNAMEEELMSNSIGEICCSTKEDTIIDFESERKVFPLDKAFGTESTQIEIYDFVGKYTIDDVLKGYNGTIFTYGQTGSGKTYTMYGVDIYDEEKKGIIPRAAEQIIDTLQKSTDLTDLEVRCSMVEIYKEKLHDLLSEEPIELKIKESPVKGIYIGGLCEIPITRYEDIMGCIDAGNDKRIMAATTQNEVSRSHALFMVEVRQTLKSGLEKRGILNLIDLAGSEKVGKTGAEGKTFEEGTKINLSLSALGNVINALSKNSEYIPYRSSKLTRLLQESLSGNFKTTLIVTISGHSTHLENSISTMKFAQRAKKLTNKVKINVKLSREQMQKLINQLKQELQQKEEQIKLYISSSPQSGINAKQDISTGQSNPARGENTFSDILGGFILKKYSEMKMINEEELQSKIISLQEENETLKEKNADLEEKLKLEKLRARKTEQRVNDLESTLDRLNAHQALSVLKSDSESTTNIILSRQLEALTKALEDAEEQCLILLKERNESIGNSEKINTYSYITVSDKIE